MRSLRPKNPDRLLIQWIVLASLMAGGFELGEWLHKKGVLPFGFRYQIHASGLGTNGSLNEIRKTELDKILRDIPAPRRIVFFAEIHAAKPGRIFFHVTRPERISLQVAGKTIPIGTQKFFIPLALNKGFNPIAIRYTLPAANPADLLVAFSENDTLLPFPFFRLVRPGKPFSLPKIVFYLVRIVDSGRTLVFALVLLLVFIRLPGFFLSAHDREVRSAISLWQLLLQSFLDIFSLFIILVFFFYMLKIPVPLVVLFWGAILGGLFFLFLACRKSGVRVAWGWEKPGAFVGISLIVLLCVWAACGSLLPLEPIGFGDFNAHLQMIKSIENQGRFMQEENRSIYPQSIHAAIVLGARILGLAPEEWITPFLMAMLVLLLFAIYLLGNELFPGIPFYLWGIALGVSNSVFIFQSMFNHYSFPAIIAVSLFFFSLFFHVRKSSLSASLSLAAGLVVYPYFAPAFLCGIFIFHFWLASPFVLKAWLQLAARLLPSLVLLGVYAGIYLAHGFTQQKEGFETAYLLNPFLSLHFWNTALIFVAIVFAFNLKRAKLVLGLFSALVCGFLANYIPYALFRAVSTYYVMKNMLLLIAAGVIYAAAAFSIAMQKYQKKKWFSPCFLTLLLLLVAGSYFQNAAKTFPRVARGATAANRWLLRHVPSQDAIVMNVGSGDWFQFFSLTLGAQRKLLSGAADSSTIPSAASWLLSDQPLAVADKTRNRLRLAAVFGDFAIFQLAKPKP